MPQTFEIAPDMGACIAESRVATANELSRVIDRMALEMDGAILAMAWEVADVYPSARLGALRRTRR